MISDRYVDQEWEKTFDILQNTIFMILQSVASLFIIIILLCGEKMCYEIMSRLSIDLIMEIKSPEVCKGRRQISSGERELNITLKMQSSQK